MTTDTQPKIVSKRVALGNATITLTGISKGAGMIRPNMATMLGYLATDAGLAPELLKDLTRAIADRSFNRITVDGDPSTNDPFIIMATGPTRMHFDPVSEPLYTPRYKALAEPAA